MSGGGTGRGSGRAHFRSKLGCCICGTKSSSSRFTASQRYAEHFVPCFGAAASGHSGDLCNACVLCVKRWLQRGKQPGCFSQVVGSKRGPGPKRMKEITKRARRREAKEQLAAALDVQNNHQHPPPVNITVPIATVPSLLPPQPFCARPLFLPPPHIINHHHHHPTTCVACWAGQNGGASNGHGCSSRNALPPATAAAGSATRTRAARRLELAEYADLDDSVSNCGELGNLVEISATGPGRRTALPDFHVQNGDYNNKNNSNQNGVVTDEWRSTSIGYSTRLSCNASAKPHCGLGEAGSGSVGSVVCTPTRCCSGGGGGGAHTNLCCDGGGGYPVVFPAEFRPPHPPRYNQSVHHHHHLLLHNSSVATAAPVDGGGWRPAGGGGVLTRASAAAAIAGSGQLVHYTNNQNYRYFDGGTASSTASSSTTSTTPSTPTRRHNRRTRLPPVKISPDGREVHDILKKIQKDSQGMNFDSRQINMAIQREIRLRSRIVGPPTPVVTNGDNPDVETNDNAPTTPLVSQKGSADAIL